MGKYTEKQKKKILKEYNYERISNMTVQEAYDLVTDLFPVGTKFHNHCWDRDLWHIISYISDDGVPLVIAKSWSKYKQFWCYKVETIWSFLYQVAMLSRD